MRRTISVAALVIAAAAALVLMVSNVLGMACPSNHAEEFTIQIESVTVDGVLQEDLSGYYEQAVVNTTLRADMERSQRPAGNDPIVADRVTIRFKPRVANYGSYDQVFRVVSGDYERLRADRHVRVRAVSRQVQLRHTVGNLLP